MDMDSPNLPHELPFRQSQPSAPRPPAAWSKLFTQHESNLQAHLDLCWKVRKHVSKTGSSFQVITAMMTQSRKCMEDLTLIRNEFMPQSTATRILAGNYTRYPEVDQTTSREEKPAPAFIFDPNPVPAMGQEKPKKRKKRIRSQESEAMSIQTDCENGSSNKRAKTQVTNTLSTKEGTHDESTMIPPVELEDISGEVEARLKRREEHRRRKEEKRRKRKRDSVDSSAAEHDRSKRVKNN